MFGGPDNVTHLRFCQHHVEHRQVWRILAENALKKKTEKEKKRSVTSGPVLLVSALLCIKVLFTGNSNIKFSHYLFTFITSISK